MKVGVLALQGDFIEHVRMLRQMGHEAIEVRLPGHLDSLDAFIMPGGESTTIGKLATRWGLIEPIRAFSQSGKPVWGTCAGLIFLAKDAGHDQPTLSLMDVTVLRNAFGRQVDSFITPLSIKGIDGGLFEGVFIRAPIIEAMGETVEVLCALEDGAVVAVRQGNLLGTSFHPELTQDPRVHQLFLQLSVLPSTN